MAAIGYHYQRQRLRRPRILKDRMNPMEIYDDVDIYDKFRFRRCDIYDLCGEIDGALQAEVRSRRGNPLPTLLQVCLTLRFFATGSFQSILGDLIGVSQSTVSRTVKKVVDCLVQRLPLYVRPPTEDEAQNSMEVFRDIAGFPGVFGCIDCTHVPIRTPHQDEDVYVNRNNVHTINVQVVCNEDMVVYQCDASSPGSFHDARILRSSSLNAAMEHQPPLVAGLLLGDSDYPIKKWLMTPFQNPATNSQQLFNEAHRTTRVVVEMCFGVMKRRWPCLSKGLAMQPDRCKRIIYCCIMLHNKARQLKLPDINFENRPYPPFVLDSQNINVTTDRQSTMAGKLIRNQIVNNYF